MLAKLKAIAASVWAFLSSEIDWTDVAIHVAVGIGLTVLIGWFGNPWYGAAIVCTLFYGREQAQQAYKNNPPTGWRKFVPVFWGPHGQAEFLPLIPVTLLVAWLLTQFMPLA